MQLEFVLCYVTMYRKAVSKINQIHIKVEYFFPFLEKESGKSAKDIVTNGNLIERRSIQIQFNKPGSNIEKNVQILLQPPTEKNEIFKKRYNTFHYLQAAHRFRFRATVMERGARRRPPPPPPPPPGLRRRR